jgi:hypothetical protein
MGRIKKKCGKAARRFAAKKTHPDYPNILLLKKSTTRNR